MEVLKEKLIEWFELKHLSRNTIENYLFYFDKFKINDLNQEYLNKFLKKYDNMVCRAFLNNLFLYIQTNDFPEELKAAILKLNIPKISGKKRIRLPNVLSKEEVHKIADNMSNTRNRLMTLLTFYGGLRVSELISIRPYDFKWDEWKSKTINPGILKVIGKGDKQREVYIIPGLMNLIYHYVKDEVSKKQNVNAPLFSINQRRWQIILSKVSKKVLDRSINPHLLRHSCATYLREKGFDLKEIAEFLGHESIVTTQIYTHINKEKLKEKIKESF